MNLFLAFEHFVDVDVCMQHIIVVVCFFKNGEFPIFNMKKSFKYANMIVCSKYDFSQKYDFS